jgi:hypothetical protein
MCPRAVHAVPALAGHTPPTRHRAYQLQSARARERGRHETSCGEAPAAPPHAPVGAPFGCVHVSAGLPVLPRIRGLRGGQALGSRRLPRTRTAVEAVELVFYGVELLYTGLVLRRIVGAPQPVLKQLLQPLQLPPVAIPRVSSEAPDGRLLFAIMKTDNN